MTKEKETYVENSEAENDDENCFQMAEDLIGERGSHSKHHIIRNIHSESKYTRSTWNNKSEGCYMYDVKG